MSENSGERPFEASPARLRKARADGDVARSVDLTGAFSFAAALLALVIGMPALGARAIVVLSSALAHPQVDSVTPALMLAAYGLVPSVAAACAAVCTGVLQGGVRLGAIGLKLERLNPAEGLRRMLSRDVAMAALRSAVAICCTIGMLAPLIFSVLSRGLQSNDSTALAGLAWTGATRIGFTGAGVAIVFGALDFGLVVVRWRKRLRMTFDELKRDQKENDGDPMVRSRRRALQREISREGLRRVQTAAFLVVNPEHIAIALEYRPPEVPVPRVLIRAADQAALRVRKAAVEHNVPIVEERALAQALYAATRAGDCIPRDLFVAVAAIVAALARDGVIAP